MSPLRPNIDVHVVDILYTDSPCVQCNCIRYESLHEDELFDLRCPGCGKLSYWGGNKDESVQVGKYERPVTVNFNITVPDAEAFRVGQEQIENNLFTQIENPFKDDPNKNDS